MLIPQNCHASPIQLYLIKTGPCVKDLTRQSGMISGTKYGNEWQRKLYVPTYQRSSLYFVKSKIIGRASGVHNRGNT